MDREIELRPLTGDALKLPLNVVQGRSAEALKEMSPDSFNLFLDAGARLTALLRQDPPSVAAVATSTGLLQIRTANLFADIERNIDSPPRTRRGPKLQGLSELVAEALASRWEDDQLPPLQTLSKLCAGALKEGPSIPQIQKVLARLEEEEILRVDRSRGPRFTTYFGLQKDALLRLWEREFMPSVSQPLTLHVIARDSDAVLARLGRVTLEGRWAVGGPAAAQLWRPTLAQTPRVEVWTDDSAWDAASSLGSRVDDKVGNLTLRRLAGGREPLWFAQHEIKGGLPLISRARAFVETSRRTGPRLDELADAVLESFT